MASQVTFRAVQSALPQEKAKLESLKRTWGRRKVCAEITSCLGCSCTSLAICIPSLLCYYCICYCALSKNRDMIAETLRCCQCMMFNAPPENNCQLACTFCTPCIAGDMPEDLTYYSTPPERQEMEAIAKRIQQMIEPISRV